MTIEAHSFARTTDARKRPQKPRKMHMTSVGAYFFFTKGLRAPQFQATWVANAISESHHRCAHLNALLHSGDASSSVAPPFRFMPINLNASGREKAAEDETEGDSLSGIRTLLTKTGKF
jgi:hypothetical protein